MELEQELKDIMDNAYNDILTEGLEKEKDAFSKIEEFLFTNNELTSLDTEIWYISSNEDDEPLESINEEDMDDATGRIDIKYKATYTNIFKALHDLDMIEECKDDGGVGIITRSQVGITHVFDPIFDEVLNKVDSLEGLITTLTTPLAVHTIIRLENEIVRITNERQDIKYGESRLVDALIHACFHW
jgi:hypothetical protein